MDEPRNSDALNAASDADIIFAVTKEILDKYKGYEIPKHFINHGVSDYFFNQPTKESNGVIRVGLSGNLLRPDIDYETLLLIIRENPQVIFEIWGNYNMEDGNLGGGTGELGNQFIQSLLESQNVQLHGSVSSNQLPAEFNRMDAFLICYDVQKDQSKGTNYHKIMEYLSTGKVIISNNVTTYSNKPGLVEMTTERNTNKHLPALFKKVIENLATYNSAILQEQRKAFAAGNTYSKQVETIEQLLKKYWGRKDL